MKKTNEEIIMEAIEKIDNIEEAEKSFLEVLNKIYKEKEDNKEKNKYLFYRMLNKLLETYINGESNLQGYLIVQLEKSFAEYIS
jgi:hypothetical protein